MRDDQAIIQLRRTGHSIPEISRITGVSRGTVWRCIQGIEIEPEYIDIWRRKQGASYYRSQAAWDKSRQAAEQLLVAFDESHYLAILASLYWAEGSKKDFAFTNTDPSMIKLVAMSLAHFGLPVSSFSVSIRIYEDMRPRLTEIRNFWAGVVGVDPASITKFHILVGKKEGKLLYGMCRIRIKKGGAYFKFIHSAIERIKLIEILPS